MTTLTVSPKYQVVIPKLVRERLRIKPGDKIELCEPRPGFIEFFNPADIPDIKDMRGRSKGGPGWEVIRKERDEHRRYEP
ncbi:MAG: AbrB/MazE/SpoVT family DNA-binding domain-containing protein [Coriobacteriia bacterium]|nr:AbrB/MazE/SpoVT family DNA-binding domain-containing protein [Coriobacteriia bacterium]